MVALDTYTQDFFQQLLEGSAQIARKYIRMARHGTLAKTDKDGRAGGNPVTLADTEIQQFIYDRLYGCPQKGIAPSRFRSAGFLGEESSDILRPREPEGGFPQSRFVVDPLDGTKPFTIGHPHWSVCNFALQERQAANDPWRGVLSGVYAPEKDLSVLADNERIILRSKGWFGDDAYHPLPELRPVTPAPGPDEAEPESQAMKLRAERLPLKGKHIDLRLVGQEAKRSMLWEQLSRNGATMRNAGPTAVTSLEFLGGRPEELGLVIGNPGGEWDWRAPEHFLGQAGFTAKPVTFKNREANGEKDYLAFIAAGSPELFARLKMDLEKTLARRPSRDVGGMQVS